MTVNVRNILRDEKDTRTIPVYPVNPDIWAANEKAQSGLTGSLAKMQKFEGKPGQIMVVPDDESGKPKAVYVGVASLDDMWSFSAASAQLPEGSYTIKAC